MLRRAGGLRRDGPAIKFEGMLASLSLRHLVGFGPLLFGAALVLGGCAGRSASHSEGDGGTGNTSGTSGGTSSGSGGRGDGAGGSTGATDSKGGGPANGGSSDIGATGGTSLGGTTDPGKGGTSVGGTSDPGSGGSGAMPNCTNVTCPSIPKSCVKLVQPEDECCPVCLDTGCQDECTDPGCKEGQHLETIPGDCCPTCVADPPDACETGQALYADLKEALVDKYGSSGCKNSSECSIVYENNDCVATCGVALPTSTVMNYTNNLDNYAAGCATCSPPAPILCPASVAACVNGKCVATWPQ